MVAEPVGELYHQTKSCSLAKISMVAERRPQKTWTPDSCSLAKISMVAELIRDTNFINACCSLAKISMVAEHHAYLVN